MIGDKAMTIMMSTSHSDPEGGFGRMSAPANEEVKDNGANPFRRRETPGRLLPIRQDNFANRHAPRILGLQSTLTNSALE